MVSFALPDLDATCQLATRLAPHLHDGDVVELVGDMGAGKTTLVGALARTLGSTEPARSPTYTVAHRYELAGGRHLAHLDLYRATGPLDEHAWGDVEPYFEDGIACVEWPAPLRAWLAGRPTWRIELVAHGLDARTCRVHPPAGRTTPPLVDALIGGGA